MRVAVATLACLFCATCSASHADRGGAGADAGARWCELDWDTVITVERGGACVDGIVIVAPTDPGRCARDCPMASPGHSVFVRPAADSPDLQIDLQREIVEAPPCVDRAWACTPKSAFPQPGPSGCQLCFSGGFHETALFPEEARDPTYRRVILAPAGLVVRLRACPVE